MIFRFIFIFSLTVTFASCSSVDLKSAQTKKSNNTSITSSNNTKKTEDSKIKEATETLIDENTVTLPNDVSGSYLNCYEITLNDKYKCVSKKEVLNWKVRNLVNNNTLNFNKKDNYSIRFSLASYQLHKKDITVESINKDGTKYSFILEKAEKEQVTESPGSALEFKSFFHLGNKSVENQSCKKQIKDAQVKRSLKKYLNFSVDKTTDITINYEKKCGSVNSNAKIALYKKNNNNYKLKEIKTFITGTNFKDLTASSYKLVFSSTNYNTQTLNLERTNTEQDKLLGFICDKTDTSGGANSCENRADSILGNIAIQNIFIKDIKVTASAAEITNED